MRKQNIGVGTPIGYKVFEPSRTFRQRPKFILPQPLGLLCIFLIIWFAVPFGMAKLDNPIISVYLSSLFLILLGIICFLLLTCLCWWILKQIWRQLDLPAIPFILSSFYSLTAWQQIILFFSLFGLLLLAASACLMAVL
jgi:hypothetical protein